MGFQEFISFVKRLDGKVLETKARKKAFELRVTPKGLQYTPKSTGIPRLHSFYFLQRVFNRFMEKESWRTTEYKDISKNASYALVLIEMYMDNRYVATREAGARKPNP